MVDAHFDKLNKRLGVVSDALRRGIAQIDKLVDIAKQ